MAIFRIKVKRRKQYFEVRINDEFYCTADTMREALTEAEQLQKLMQAIYDNALVVPIDIDLK